MPEGDSENRRNKIPEHPERTAAVALMEKIVDGHGEKFPRLRQQLDIILCAADATVRQKGNFQLRINNVRTAMNEEDKNEFVLKELLDRFNAYIDEYRS